MKTYKSNKKQKKILIIAAVIVGILVLASITIVVIGTRRGTKPSTNTTVDESSSLNSTNKKSYVEDKSNATTTNTAQGQTTDDISISTRQEADGTIIITTKLLNYSDGTCNLTMKNGSSAYVKDVDIIYQPDFSTCAGFSIPKNELSSGTWQISLAVTSKGQVNTKTTTVEVK